MTKFVITTEHVYWWPITVLVPDPDNAGKVIKQEFEAKFRAMSRDEAEALDREIGALSLAEAITREHDVLRHVFKGWNDQVVGDDGEPIPFSAEALEAALQFSWFPIGCYRGYRQSLQGEVARLGN